MRTKNYYPALIIVLIFVFSACENSKNPSITNPPDEQPIVKTKTEELNELIHPLNGASPSLNHDDLQPLSFLRDSRFVGLGEATHGTKEFFQLKHRIFKYLVENHDFKIFGFECDMGESIFFDRYICTGEGNIDDLMNTKMHFWTWSTEEVKALLEWMKTYNESKFEEDKIHYIGVDCQYLTYQPDLILDYISNVKPEFLDEINPTMQMIKNMDNTSSYAVRQYYANMTLQQKQELSDSLDNILTQFITVENDLIANSSPFEYKIHKQLIRNIQQAHDALYAVAHNIYNINYRDKYMAENSIWLNELLSTNTQVAIWAHNAHVANDMNYGGDGSMGYHLKNQYDNEYQIIGFSFSKGSFTAITQIAPGSYSGLDKQTIDSDPKEDSINSLFSNAQYDNFILNLAEMSPISALGVWLGQTRPFLSVGSVYDGNPEKYYRNVILTDQYDIIFHYDNTTEAIQIN